VDELERVRELQAAAQLAGDEYSAALWRYIAARKEAGDVPPSSSCGCGDCWWAYLEGGT
jgi:hypothetical protein